MHVDFLDVLLGEAGRPLQAAFVAVALVALLESLMALFWVAPYYRTALPIFRRKIPVTELGYADLSEAVPMLEQHLQGNWLRTTTVFRAIAPHQLAFRYKFGQQVKYPVMGRVTFDAHDRALIVTGCNFWVLLFFPVLGLFALVFYFQSVWQAFVWLYLIPVMIAQVIHAVYMRAGYKQIAGVVEELLPAHSSS